MGHPIRNLLPGLLLLAAACATEAAAPVSTAPTEQRVILKIDQGIVFSTGTLTEGAAFQASDLVALAHQGDVDLKSGVEPGTTDHLLMKVFHQNNLDTGPNQVFDSLDNVPATHPDGSTPGDFLRRAAKGNGLVVQNNISCRRARRDHIHRGTYTNQRCVEGHTKVWVELYNAAGGQVVLRYLMIQ